MNTVYSLPLVPFVSEIPSSTEYKPLASIINTIGSKGAKSFGDCSLTTLDDGAIITLTKYQVNNKFVVKGSGEYTVYVKIFSDATHPDVVAYLNSATGPSASDRVNSMFKGLNSLI